MAIAVGQNLARRHAMGKACGPGRNRSSIKNTMFSCRCRFAGWIVPSNGFLARETRFSLVIYPMMQTGHALHLGFPKE